MFDALASERQLVEIRRKIKKLQRDIIDSKSRLANLMNVDPRDPIRSRSRHAIGSSPEIAGRTARACPQSGS